MPTPCLLMLFNEVVAAVSVGAWSPRLTPVLHPALRLVATLATFALHRRLPGALLTVASVAITLAAVVSWRAPVTRATFRS